MGAHVSQDGPPAGYKLRLVPVDKIADPRPDDDPEVAWVLDGIRNLTSNGPFEVVADVGPDRRITMSRVFFEENVEVTG